MKTFLSHRGLEITQENIGSWQGNILIKKSLDNSPIRTTIEYSSQR